MADMSWAKKYGFTPGKTILMGVLSVVFLWVLSAQLGGSGNSAQLKPRRDTKPRIRKVANNRPSRRSLPPSRNRANSASSEGDLPVEPSERVNIPWPNLKLAEVIEYDPFKIDRPEPRVEVEQESPHPPVNGSNPLKAIATVVESQLEEIQAKQEREQSLQSIRKLGVDMILSGNGGKVAIVGKRSVRVGDTIDGFRVKDITSAGIILVNE